MPTKTLTFAVVAGFVSALAASAVLAAPIVTFTQTMLTRPQNGVTYSALDFFYSSTPGFEFTHYQLIVNTISGNHIHDPARLQDDRQYNSVNQGINAGSVDTFANTVMSAAAKDDGGYLSNIIVNPGSYSPTGSGAAAPFSLLDWDVFDTATGDDNNLNDHPDGPFGVTAPYHIARVLVTPGASGTAEFRAFDTGSNGQPTVFNFSGESFFADDAVLNNVNASDPGMVMHTFTASGVPSGPVTWSGFAFDSYTPAYGGAGTGPANPAAFDPNTQKFSWNSVGSPRGVYKWVATVSDAAGSDQGMLTVHVTEVPEPSTFALCGLAMVSLVGLFRRR